MEPQPLMQAASSGFGPVHTKLENPQSQSKTVKVEVPVKVKPSNSRGERISQRDRQWNCYQDSVSSQSMIQNYSNFKRTGAPTKLMQWNGGVWTQFSDEVLSAAKQAFSEKRPVVEIEVDGNHYIFDFFRMLQIDLSSGLQRSIAWIDVSGDCFFPKFFVDESLLDDDDDGDDDEENPRVEIEIKINTDNKDNCDDENNTDNNDDENSSNDRNSSNNGGGNWSGCGKRKRKVREMKVEYEEDDTADSSCNNNNDDGDDGEKENAKRQRLVGGGGVGEATTALWPNARLLGEGEKFSSVVRGLFMNGMKNIDPCVEITSIHQLVRTGPVERARWEAFHKQMEMTNVIRGRSNTVFAWYGASRKGVEDIMAHGFGWRSSRIVGPRAHGIGVYLSPARLPHVSNVFSKADDNGEKHLVLCRVILGNVEKVEAGSRQFYPSSVNFDSGADDLVNPKWYVVWSTNMNTHILPECVVSYKCSGSQPQPGQVKEAEFMDWIPNGSRAVIMKLFSRLQSSLPDTKLEELKALCMTFKAGKMGKHLFIQQLRSVAGAEVLRSAISGLQCPN